MRLNEEENNIELDVEDSAKATRINKRKVVVPHGTANNLDNYKDFVEIDNDELRYRLCDVLDKSYLINFIRPDMQWVICNSSDHLVLSIHPKNGEYSVDTLPSQSIYIKKELRGVIEDVLSIALNEKLLREDDVEIDLDDGSDIDLDIADESGNYSVSYEDDSFKLCNPNNEWGMIILSKGTTWLSGTYAWDRHKDGYDEVNDDSYILQDYSEQYILLDKKNEKKKYRIEKGYGDIFVPSGARYSAATWIATNGTLGLKKWFLSANFPFITTNLKKKVGSEIIGKKTTFVYPTDEDPGWNARRQSTQIKNIKIVKGTESIKDLGGFPSVKSIVVPEGVKRINRYGFAYMPSLEKVSLPSTLTTIGEGAFNKCDKLTSIFIPASVKTIKNPIAMADVWVSWWGRSEEEAMREFEEKARPYKERLTFYCEASEKPSGWSNDWNNITYRYSARGELPACCKYNVVWGASRASAGLTEDVDSPVELDEINLDLNGRKLSEDELVRLEDARTNSNLDLDDLNQLWNSYPHNNEKGQWYIFKVEDDDEFFHEYNIKYPFVIVYQGYEECGPECFHDRLLKGQGVGRVSPNLLANAEIEGMESIPSTSSSRINEDVDLDDGEDIELDIAETPAQIKKLFEDDTWIVSTPLNYFGLIELSKDTSWGYEEEMEKKLDGEHRDDDFDPSDDFKLNSWNNYKIYVFRNKKNGDVFGYSPNSWCPPNGDYHGYMHDKNCGIMNEYRPKRGWFRNGADMLSAFLKVEGTIKLIEWAAKKWKGGLGNLKYFAIAKTKADEINSTLEYGSELHNKILSASHWGYDPDELSALELRHLIKNIVFKGDETSIKRSAFFQFSNIEKIEIPDSVTIIEESAFQECSKLRDVKLPASLKTIGHYAFYECSSLKSIIIPEGTTRIGASVFNWCSELSDVYIPSTVTELEKRSSFMHISPTVTIRLGATEAPDYFEDLKHQVENSWGHGRGTVLLNQKPSDVNLTEDIDTDDVELDVVDRVDWRVGREEYINNLKKTARNYGAEIVEYDGLYPLRKDAVWDNHYTVKIDDRWTFDVYTSGELLIYENGTDEWVDDLEEVGIFTDDDVYELIGFEDDKPYQYGYDNYRYCGFTLHDNKKGYDYFSNDYGYDDGDTIDDYDLDFLLSEAIPDMISEITEGEVDEDNIPPDAIRESDDELELDSTDDEIKFVDMSELSYSSKELLADCYSDYFDELDNDLGLISGTRKSPEGKLIRGLLLSDEHPLMLNLNVPMSKWDKGSIGYMENDEYVAFLPLPKEIYNELIELGLLDGTNDNSGYTLEEE